MVRSVANLTRAEGESFLDLVTPAGIRTETETFALEDVNAALDRLRTGKRTGAAVLCPR